MLKVLVRADSRYPVNRKLIRRTIGDVLVKEKLTNIEVEVSVNVCGSRQMREITERFLGDGKAHEILSFPLEDPLAGGAFKASPDEVLRLGDIILCWPEVVARAGRDNVLVDEETRRLVVHGVEHLLGKHHDAKLT